MEVWTVYQGNSHSLELHAQRHIIGWIVLQVIPTWWKYGLCTRGIPIRLNRMPSVISSGESSLLQLSMSSFAIRSRASLLNTILQKSVLIMFDAFSNNIVNPCCQVQQSILLPDALFKSILRIFECCTIILQLLGKWATEKTVDRSTVHCWLITWQMASWSVKCPDVNDKHWRTVDGISLI